MKNIKFIIIGFAKSMTNSAFQGGDLKVDMTSALAIQLRKWVAKAERIFVVSISALKGGVSHFGRWNTAFSLVFTLFFVACSEKEAPKSAEVVAAKPASDSLTLTDEQMQLMHIELGKAERHALTGTIVATGKVAILANDMADVSSPLRGTVQQIVAHEGQFVKKGELLMVLTSPEIIAFQRDYLMAQSELFFLEKELERQQIMAKENIEIGRAHV